MNLLQVSEAIHFLGDNLNFLGLDVVARRLVWKIIQELKEEGKTVIFTTQFMDDAEELADRLAILSKG